MPKRNAFDALAEALEILPNVGSKSAQRIAYHLLQHNRAGAVNLIACLQEALNQVKHCRLCNTFCDEEICGICSDQKRDPSKLMVVQMPLDVSIIEAANCHNGLYFVLMGAVQPIQNIDLNSIAIQKLIDRLKVTNVTEIIIATNFTAEGEATAFILKQVLQKLPYKISRLARGMPLGGELEFVDLGTIAQSIYERKQFEEEK